MLALTVLKLPKDEMFHKRMMGSKICYTKTRQTIEEAEFEEIGADKCKPAGGDDLYDAGSPAFVEHLLCCKRGVAFADHSMMMGGVFNAVVQNIAA